MTTVKTLFLSAILAGGLAAAGGVEATVLYVNPPDLSGNQDGDCVYNTTCGSQFTGNTYGAQEFTLSTAATVNRPASIRSCLVPPRRA